MKKLIFILFILFIGLILSRIKSDSFKTENPNTFDNIQIHLFSPQKLMLNKKIFNFMSEFILFTEKKFGNDNKYAIYIENLMGDRHLITMYLLKKNEKIDQNEYIGYMSFLQKKIYISLCMNSILESNNKKEEEITFNDNNYFYWQFILIRNEGTIQNDGNFQTSIYKYKIETDSLEQKPLKHK